MFKRLIAGFGKMPPVPDLAALQDEAVRGVVAGVHDLHEGEWGDREWVYIAVNHEVLIEEGRRSSTQASVLAHVPGGELESLSFRLGMATKQALLDLREAMVAKGQEPWTILDLTIRPEGRYDFSFGYGRPPRLNGDLMHSTHKSLLARYKAERG